MAFALLDDEFYAHPKIVAVGNAGAGLYTRALSYCGKHLTDGFVPAGWAREAGGSALCRKVEQAGLWKKVEGGYQIPDFTAYNPPREVVLKRRAELSEKRAEAGRRGAEARWGHSKAYGKHHGKPDGKDDGNGDGSEMPPVPLNPKPLNPKEEPSSSVDAAHDDDLVKLLESLGPTKRQQEAWLTAARTEPDRIRACAHAARAADKPAAYMATLIDRGQWPNTGDPPNGRPKLTDEQRHERALRWVRTIGIEILNPDDLEREARRIDPDLVPAMRAEWEKLEHAGQDAPLPKDEAA